MNRKEVIGAIAQRTGSPVADAERCLAALEDVMIDAIARGDKVQLPGILTLERVERAARTGRNPRTGEAMNIPAGFAVKAAVGSRLKGAVA